MRWAASAAALILFAACGGDTPAESTDSPDAEDTPSEGTPSTGHDSPTESARLTVVFTNNIDGEIEPCG